ncbi:MAG: ABC transporter permease, partial [Saprospiraceae bacterium]|nr:ABC transporter permease [Saprospiraceae bacterium]
MLKTNLLIALRNLRKNRLYSGLNIAGLAIGLAAALLIALYVGHELSYDRWNPQADRIVRAAADINFAGHHYELAVVSSVMAPEAARELPEIQAWCRFRDYGSYLVRRDGEAQQNIREEDVLTVDSSFFEVFPLRVIEGDPGRCLTSPDAVVLSKSRAEKYFSSPQLALGKTLVLENNQRRTVTAVFEDMPVNSHFHADLLLSMNGNEEVKSDPQTWASNNNFQTYFLLRKGVDKNRFREKFARLSEEKIAANVQQMLGTSVAELEKTGQYARYYLQDLEDIHLYSDLTVELAPNGSIRYVWIFSAIAVFILLIACINFMNLATARSAGRAREIGVRKVLGGRRSALVGQFLGESLVLTSIAVAFALVLAAVAMPWYRELSGRTLDIPWSAPVFWLALGGGTLLVSLLAGAYPAFFLSAFDAVKVIKGQASVQGRRSLRGALVVFQCAISVALIIATMLVFRQLSYIQQKKLGFDKSRVIVLDNAYALGDKL